jgi:hypothetical protein
MALNVATFCRLTEYDESLAIFWCVRQPVNGSLAAGLIYLL